MDLAQFILENPEKVITYTIDDFSKNTFTSTSSIVRFCKKIGFKGYSEFKIKLAIEINTFILNNTRIEVDMPIRKEATSAEISQTLLNLHYQTLTDVYYGLDLGNMSEIAEMIYHSDYLMLKGYGPSLLIAEDFYYKVRRIGIVCQNEALAGFETQIFPNAAKNPVMFVVSHYANSILIRNLILEGNAQKIPVVLLTCNRESPLIKLVSKVIIVDSPEQDRMNKLGSLASRTGMTYVLDILYSMLFTKDYDRNVKVLYDFGQRNSQRGIYMNELKELIKK